jgi:ribosomal protein S18 acetylase RimI-like enzyme
MPDAYAIRRAEPRDADDVAALVYESAGGMFDVYAGGRERALHVIRAAFERDGNSTSREVVTVAEADGRVVGALAAFPVGELDDRARRFLRVTLRRTPPWGWRMTLRVFRLGASLTPPPPADALYVDALATDREHRRRGVATALLEAAGDQAARQGLAAVALDTGLENRTAQALYERAGFEVSGRRPPAHGLPGFMGLVRRPP